MTLRVVTLPVDVDPLEAPALARSLRKRGAHLLELRTDLHPPSRLDVATLAAEIDLLISRRGPPAPLVWLQHAAWVDGEVGQRRIRSVHLEAPLFPAEALELWLGLAPRPGELIKHVEPLGPLTSADRLLATQGRLRARFGDRVTVLATGRAALPWRAVLARNNALDYLAASPGWCAAPGQRLLEDAVRSDRAVAPARLGILGSRLGHSRSPRVHQQPFDRIDVPADTELAALLQALVPHYAGLAVTSPFKRAAARAAGSGLPAVNTLVRSGGRWHAFNTDVLGARAVLERLGAEAITVLGSGGAAAAALQAAADARIRATLLTRATLPVPPLRGAVLWTWPPDVPVAAGLRFDGARVAVIAYGSGARLLGKTIAARGGTPLLLGTTWFVAQARAQRARWEEAT